MRITQIAQENQPEWLKVTTFNSTKLKSSNFYSNFTVSKPVEVSLNASLASSSGIAAMVDAGLTRTLRLNDKIDSRLKRVEEALSYLSDAAKQASDSNISSASRTALQDRADSLLKDIQKLGRNTNDNDGRPLLRGGIWEYTATENGNQARMTLPDVRTKSLKLDQISFASASDSESAQKSIAAAQKQLGNQRALLSTERDSVEVYRQDLNTRMGIVRNQYRDSASTQLYPNGGNNQANPMVQFLQNLMSGQAERLNLDRILNLFDQTDNLKSQADAIKTTQPAKANANSKKPI